MNKSSLTNGVKNESAVIVGASLSGLMTGIPLAREGLHITILEKVGAAQRTGAGLRVDGGSGEQTETARLLRAIASGGRESV